MIRGLGVETRFTEVLYHRTLKISYGGPPVLSLPPGARRVSGQSQSWPGAHLLPGRRREVTSNGVSYPTFTNVATPLIWVPTTVLPLMRRPPMSP